MKFSSLANYFQKIEKTPSRNQMMEILANLLSQASPEEIDELVYLSLGELAPKFNKIEFNLADKMVIRSIAQAFRTKPSQVTSIYKQIGDLGEVAQKLSSQKKTGLSVEKVYHLLKTIAQDSGQGSQERKVSSLAQLISDLDSLSIRFVIRIVLGRLRLGFSDKTILDALSWMRRGSKEGRKELDWAYQVFPDVGKIASQVKKGGIKSLRSKIAVTIGVPVLPALAQRLKTSQEMIKKMGTVIAEPKFDGTRVQIHYNRNVEEKVTQTNSLFKHLEEKSANQVRTFTRNLDENSHMFPELKTIKDQLKAKSAIIDTEAIGFNPKSGKLLSFQMTITRKRKHGIKSAQSSVPLKFYAFDILYKNGVSLIEKPLTERRKILASTIKTKKEGSLIIDEYIITNDPTKLKKYHKTQLDKGLEGAMVKKSKGRYTSGRTDWNWVKFKEAEDSKAKLSDTIDGVVMGYYKGKGRRASFGIGAFLVGIMEKGQFLTIAKIGTGLTDKQWKEMKNRSERFKVNTMPKEYKVTNKSLIPDHWLDPNIVVEIAADEITNSPTHSAGLALRFPRLVRFRDDKSIHQSTSLKEISHLV